MRADQRYRVPESRITELAMRLESREKEARPLFDEGEEFDEWPEQEQEERSA